MSLTLAIATSGGRNSIAIGQAGRLSWAGDDAAPESLADAVAAALRAVEARPRDIATVAVDIGPGGLGATRCGVAFANALGFALSVPVWPVRSFTCIAAGIRAGGGGEAPVVCLAPAADGRVYAGLSPAAAGMSGPGAETLRFGDPETVVPRLTRGLRRFTAAGKARARLAALCPDAVITDSGIDGPAAAWMIPLVPPHASLPPPAAQALPVTEQDPALRA